MFCKRKRYSQIYNLIGLELMANIADNVIALQAQVTALDAKVSGITAPDLSTVAKADALAVVATTVTDIQTKVTPSV